MTSHDDFLSIVQIASTKGSDSQVSGKFVSVIDASGSMSPYWRHIATLFNEYTPRESTRITFSGDAKLCKDNRLSPDLYVHGGGLTNIPAAFTLLDRIISDTDVSVPMTVLFVSDGQDNNLNTLPDRLARLKGHQRRKITFLCLGIQSAFPTFLSMSLRELYHSTQSSIPALFLIEYFTEAALRNKLEAMREHFQLRRKVPVDPPVKEFPWSFEPSDQLYEGTYLVLSSEDVAGHQFSINGVSLDLRQHPPTIDLLLEVFRAFTQEMEMLSLSKSGCLAEQAGEARRVMRQLLDYFKDHHQLDLLKEFKLIGTLDTEDVQEEVDHLMRQDFRQRVQFNKLRHNQFRIKGYYENVELLAKGLGCQQLSEWEAAKRIGIGTITGNYHQRAMNLRGLTVDAFKILRNEFVETFKSVPPLQSRSEQEESIVTLENQKDVFLDPEFVSGLLACESQFDLVESLPVVGLALQVRRPNGLDLNPWLVEVKAMAKHNRQLDSFSLLKSDFRMTLSVGSGETELVNAVLPLFTLKDGDMQPLLAHKLFHLLMTFVLHRNVDTLDTNAYLSLLGNTWLYLLSQPDSEYKQTLIQSIFETIQLVYGATDEHTVYKQKLLEQPEQTICHGENLSRTLLYILLLHRADALKQDTAKEMIPLLFATYFKSVATESWTSYVSVESAAVDKLMDEVIATCEKEFDQFRTFRDLSTRFAALSGKQLRQAVADVTDSPITLKSARFEIKGEKISLSTLLHVSQEVLGSQPSSEELALILFVASRSQPSSWREGLRQSTTEVMKDMRVTLNESDGTFAILQEEALQTLKRNFALYFQKIHAHILPLSPQDVVEACKQRGVEPKKLMYDNERHLVRNACMAPDCPFFLEPSTTLGKHLGTWQGKCPRAFHKLLKERPFDDPATLLDKLLSGEAQVPPRIPQTLEDFYPSDRTEALEYISKVAKAYQSIEQQTDTDHLAELSPYVSQPPKHKHKKRNNRWRGRGRKGRR